MILHFDIYTWLICHPNYSQIFCHHNYFKFSLNFILNRFFFIFLQEIPVEWFLHFIFIYSSNINVHYFVLLHNTSGMFWFGIYWKKYFLVCRKLLKSFYDVTHFSLQKCLIHLSIYITMYTLYIIMSIFKDILDTCIRVLSACFVSLLNISFIQNLVNFLDHFVD